MQPPAVSVILKTVAACDGVNASVGAEGQEVGARVCGEGGAQSRRTRRQIDIVDSDSGIVHKGSRDQERPCTGPACQKSEIGKAEVPGGR